MKRLKEGMVVRVWGNAGRHPSYDGDAYVYGRRARVDTVWRTDSTAVDYQVGVEFLDGIMKGQFRTVSNCQLFTPRGKRK